MLTLVVLSLFAVDDEWSQLPKPAPAPVAGAPLQAPDLSPRARYDSALRYLQANKPGEASRILDPLIAEFPRVPEYFAARAQAQLALNNALFASADAQYALALKPELSGTRYVLASAEEALGRLASAAAHYRLYAAAADARTDLKAEALRRASRLAPEQRAPAPLPAPLPAPQPARLAAAPATPAPECRMGTNGRQACGYHCNMGTDGVVACADTPDGVCAMGTDGRVVCSELGRNVPAGGPAPECRMGTDGRQTCGYNCRMGTNGHFYCANRPDGQCAMNTDGTFSCR